jgi:hypothetical protein
MHVIVVKYMVSVLCTCHVSFLDLLQTWCGECTDLRRAAMVTGGWRGRHFVVRWRQSVIKLFCCVFL